MYLSGAVAIIVLILAILMMLGVVPLSAPFVGGMFVAICVGLAGPIFIKTA